MIRTYEGWLYPSVVIDLFSRRVVGWSMHSRMTTELVLNKCVIDGRVAQKPPGYSNCTLDQGSQYTSHEWNSFLKKRRLQSRMNRRGNCYDNAVAESFFQLLKRARIKRTIYISREKARLDVFDYIVESLSSSRF